AGRKYLAVEEHIASRLDALSDEDGTGHLAAVRIFRRPEPVYAGGE
ncbi:MAG: hypothetical protein JO100_00085, partial [Pseudonocardia sp.]|nr:hypothetical protein [Pseudonocardia sp.]